MRPMRQGGYAERIERAVARLSAGLSAQEAPGLEELAAAAALSPHHFHRVYRLMTGETVAETVRRLRVAAGLLAVEDGRSITAAAQEAAYASSQSFSRAVRATVGQSVSGLRASGTATEVAEALRRPALRVAAPISVELVTLAPFRVASLLNVGDYAALNLGYQRLIEAVAASAGLEAIAGVYGVPIDDPRDVPVKAHRFICCVDVGKAVVDAAEFGPAELGGGAYAVSRCTGTYDAIPQQIDDLYRHAIDQGWELADRALHVHYVDQPTADGAGEHSSDIYLPIAA